MFVAGPTRMKVVELLLALLKTVCLLYVGSEQFIFVLIYIRVSVFILLALC